MKKQWIVSGLIGVCIGTMFAAQEAEAAAVYAATGTCSWSTAESMETTDGGRVRALATSGIEHRIRCGLVAPDHLSADTDDDVYVYYTDNNSETGMEDHVICNVHTCDLDSTDCNSETSRFSCATGGGCTSVPGSFTGSGNLAFTNLDKPAYFNTFVSCAIPHDTAGADPSSVNAFWYVY